MQNQMHALKQMLFLAIAAILLWVPRAGAQDADDPASDRQQIYVCNQGAAALTVIDAQTHEVTDRIDLQELGFSANAKPHHAVAEPDGSHWYVSLIGENRVLKFNRQNELVAQAELEVPGLLELHPTRDLLLVGRSMSAVNPPQSIGVIRRSDMTLEREIDTFFPRPHAISVTPDGNWTYVASLAENLILSLDIETGETSLTTLEGAPHVFVDFAISPDGNTMVVTGQVSGSLLVFDIGEPASPVLTDTVEVDAQPWHPLFTEDGKTVWFGSKQANTVTAVDMEKRDVKAVVEGDGIAQPHGSALSADGKYLFIAGNNMNGTWGNGHSGDGDPPGTVVVIRTDTREIVKVIEVGANATGIGTNARW